MGSHFKEQDSVSTLTEMSNAVQSSTESRHDCVVCLLNMREKILVLAKEVCPFDKGVLQRRLLHAISTDLRNNKIRNDLHPTLENNKISGKHLLQIVSEAVVNDSERHEKLSKEKKEIKVNKIDNVDNPLLNEIRAIKLEQSTELVAFCVEILQIKKAVNSRNIFAKNVSGDALIVLSLNLIVCTVLYVVLLSTKSLSVLTMIKKTSEVAQERHAATLSNKTSCNICCVCKKNVKILYKCMKCHSGNFCLKACQIKQYREHKKLLCSYFRIR